MSKILEYALKEIKEGPIKSIYYAIGIVVALIGFIVLINPSSIVDTIKSGIGLESADELNSIGEELYGQGNYKEAVLYFDRAIKLNPSYKVAYFNKGLALYSQEKYNKSIEALDNAITLDQKYAKAWCVKGLAQYGLKLYEDAINCINKSLEFDSENPTNWYFKGVIYLDNKEYNESIRAIDMALDIDPQFADAWYDKFMALTALGFETEANEAFWEAKEHGYMPRAVGQKRTYDI